MKVVRLQANIVSISGSVKQTNRGTNTKTESSVNWSFKLKQRIVQRVNGIIVIFQAGLLLYLGEVNIFNTK